MKSTQFLSQKEKETGIKYLSKHQRFNGSGFNFLGDASISLLAIYFGANNVQLGYLSSTLYVSGVLLLLVPKIFAGANFSKLYFWAWLTRGLLCLLYSLLWFVTGNTAVMIIMITYSLFCGTRIIGASLYQPIIKMLSNSRNRGEIVGKASINFQVTVSLSKVASFIMTSIEKFSGAAGILLLQYVGLIFNTLAAININKVPCRETVTYKKGNNIWKTFVSAMKEKELRPAIFISWANVSLIILFSFIIPFLRREAHFSTSMIFLYSLVISGSTIFAGLYTKSFADRLGSKPLLFVSFLASAACFLIWVFLPAETPKYIILPLALCTGFFIYSNDMLVGRILVRNLPEKDIVSYNAMINFVIALISIAVGTGGGLLADNLSKANIHTANIYSLTFFSAVLIAVLSIFLTLKLAEPESRSKREVIGILFSPTNLQSFRLIGRLEKEKDPVNRRTILMHIGKTDNALTTEELHSIMANPYSGDKGEIIKSLFNFPRKKILPDLLKEAENPSAIYRIEAIFALGAHPSPESEKLLEKLLFDKNPEIRSNAAKSLSRIGGSRQADEIKRQAVDAQGIWNKMNYIVALKNVDTEGEYLEHIFSPDILNENKTFRQVIYSLYADILGFTPGLDEFYKKRNLKKGEGINDFLDEARDVQGFLESRDDFVNWLSNDETETVCKRCIELLKDSEIDTKLIHLKKSIIKMPVKERDYDDALAVLYLTYNLLKQ
ncbi:MAG: MFS transporter [Spirochaetales bacterium]|nr:MFS transporter [Spirochaetales bacterium]